MRRRRGFVLLARHLAPRRRAIVHVAAWSLVESLPAFASGILVATSLDHGFLQRRPLEGLGWLGLLGVTLTVRAFATRRLYPWLAETVEPLRDGLVRDLVTAVVSQGVAEPRQPDIAGVARLTEQVELVRQLVSALLRATSQFGFAMLASLVGIAALAPRVALLVAPLLLFALALYWGSLGTLSTRQRSVVLAGEAIPQAAGAVLTGLRDVVACGAERRAAATVGDPIDLQARAERALARVGAVRTLVVVVGGQLPVLAVLLAAPGLIQRQQLSVGAVAGTVAYLTTSLEPALRSFVHVAGTMGLQLSVVLGRLAEACALPPQHAVTSGLTPTAHDLLVDGVTFAYGPHAEPVMADLSLELRHGEHLAIVGPSGIGKSTLANLLAGLIQPQHGEVRLGGVALDRLDEAHLRRTVALIPQEAYVFADTLRENLTYLRPDASDGELDQAVEVAGLRPTVERLGGYDALVGAGGVTLSAGERQLVALVRVYLSLAEIVLLDEATCHLDPVAEARAEQAFASRSGTLVVIAHRISSALRAERILLMDGAKPLIGTHQSLLASSSLYADLVGSWQGEAPSKLAARSLGALSERGAAQRRCAT
ncbi:MAG: ABC transporter ATP-binding protein [Pseudonocardiaceae bacterium]